MRATKLAYLNLARKMFCKKWEELCGSTPLHLNDNERRRSNNDSEVLFLFDVDQDELVNDIRLRFRNINE